MQILRQRDHEQLLPSYSKIFSTIRGHLVEKILLNSVDARASKHISSNFTGENKNKHLTRLSRPEDLIEFCRRESFCQGTLSVVGNLNSGSL
jgi:hypothetical protein